MKTTRRLHAFALWLLPLALSALAGGGCVRYELDVVQPQDLAGPVPSNKPVELPIEPLVYQLQTAEDRLVVIIHNDTDDAVKLLGDDSYVVDPKGESHPLPTRAIASRSATKLILPPVPPTIRSQPAFGIGFGVGLSSAGYRRRGHFLHNYDDFHTPRYYTVEDDGTTYWDWGGEGPIRLRFVYEQGSERVVHNLELIRRKA
jgi:hypothetical protein